MTVVRPNPLRRRDGRPPKVSEMVAQRLVNYMIEEGLAPGTRLASEQVMQADLSVGRGTLREALRILESRGVIYIRPGAGGGAFVRRPEAEDLSEALTLIMQFEGGSIEHVIQTRRELELVALERAAKRLTKTDLANLEQSTRIIRQHPDDKTTFVRESRNFHVTITDAAGLLPLRIFCRALHTITATAIMGVPYSASRSLSVADAHDRILSFLREGDAAGAVEAMSRHLEASSDFWKTHMGGLGRMPVEWVQLRSFM